MTTDPDSRSKQRALLIAIPLILLVFVLLIAISYWRANANRGASDDAGTATQEMVEP